MPASFQSKFRMSVAGGDQWTFGGRGLAVFALSPRRGAQGHKLVIVPGKGHFVWLKSRWHSGMSILGAVSSKNISNSNNS